MDESWKSIYEIEETKPDLWGEKRWKKYLEVEATADTLGDYLRFRKQCGHRTYPHTRPAGITERWFGLGAVIKADDRVDPAFGKGQSDPVLLLTAHIDTFSTKHTAVRIVIK